MTDQAGQAGNLSNLSPSQFLPNLTPVDSRLYHLLLTLEFLPLLDSVKRGNPNSSCSCSHLHPTKDNSQNNRIPSTS